MKVDAVSRTFYSAKKKLKILSEKRAKNIYSPEEIMQMPTTQVWSEIKSIAISLTNIFAK